MLMITAVCSIQLFVSCIILVHVVENNHKQMMICFLFYFKSYSVSVIVYFNIVVGYKAISLIQIKTIFSYNGKLIQARQLFCCSSHISHTELCKACKSSMMSAES